MNSNAGKKPVADKTLATEIQKLESRVSENPRSPLFSRLAGLYNQAGEYDKSEKILTAGIRSYPEYTTAYLVLVDAYVGKKELEKARDTLEKLLLINPSSFKAHRLLADISMENEHFDVALSHYRMANRFDPLNRDIIQLIKEIKDSAIAQASEKSKKKEEQTELRRQVKEATDLNVIESAKSPEEMEKYKALLQNSEGIEDEPAETVAEKTAIEEKSKGVPESEVEKKTDDAGVMAGSFTDDAGIIYFIDDDEVSFEQYKKRLEFVKEGKARIVSKEEFSKKARAAGKKIEEPAREKPVVSTPTEEVDAGVVEPDQARSELKEVAETVSVDGEPTFEEPITDESDPNALLEVIEMSYRDYLDLLDDEEDLLEALFPEDHPRDDYLETSGYEDILEEETAVDKTTEEKLTYQEYLSQLTDPAERAEADLGSEQGMRYGEYVATLSEDSEKADAAGLAEPDDGQLMSYQEYLASTEDEVVSFADFAAEQVLDPPAVEVSAVPKVTAPKRQSAEKEPEDISLEAFEEVEKTPPPLTDEIDSVDIEREVVQGITVKPAVKETPEAEPVAEIKSVVKDEATAAGGDLTADDIAEEEVEEEVGEAIDASKASPEMADTFLTQGKFGKAYQVYQILKESQSDDPKIDRKLSELRKLSVWSRQLAG